MQKPHFTEDHCRYDNDAKTIAYPMDSKFHVVMFWAGYNINMNYLKEARGAFAVNLFTICRLIDTRHSQKSTELVAQFFEKLIDSGLAS